MTLIVTRKADPKALADLMEHGMGEFEANIYAARGIGHPDELSVDLAHLLPFHTLKNIDTAVAILREAIYTQARILIVADYDADGATACAVAVKGLTLLGAKVDFLIPNRFEDGYGLTPEIVDEAAKRQPHLIVTVDNGISSMAGVARARTHNIDVLITDHHLPGEVLPDAVIVNPNQPGCAFPSKNLAGVGVIFYVLLALRAKMREAGDFSQQAEQGDLLLRRELADILPRRERADILPRREQADILSRREPRLASLLDLVALGTVADVVKLDSNNRILVAQGLKRIRAGQACAGIAALFTVSGRNPQQAGAFDLGFTLGPRLNAAGRLEDMSLGVACLLTEDSRVAATIAQQLDQLNHERRHIEAHIQEEAQAILAAIEVQTQHSVSLFHPDWHQGVIGIVASRIKEHYHRPCFVFAQGTAGEIKGSGRSIVGLHLRDTLDLLDKAAPGVLLRFGGHAMAAGVTILQQDFPTFAAHFEQICARLLDESTLQKSLYIDGTPPEAAYTLAQVEKLENQIWGQGFQAPLFMDQFELVSQRVVGEKHLKLQLKSLHGQLLDAMHFQSTDLLPPVFSGVFRLNVNTFQQRQMVQLIFQHIVS